MREVSCPSTSATAKYIPNRITSSALEMKRFAIGARKQKSQTRALAAAAKRVGPGPINNAMMTTTNR